MHSLWRTYLDNLRDIVSREIPRVSSCDTWTMLRHDRDRRDRTRPLCAILHLSGCTEQEKKIMYNMEEITCTDSAPITTFVPCNC
jgi:hypothetical protein